MVSHYDTSILYSGGGSHANGGEVGGGSPSRFVPSEELEPAPVMPMNNGNEGSSSSSSAPVTENYNPPQGVFEMMAVMELEQQSTSGQNSTATDDQDQDNSDEDGEDFPHDDHHDTDANDLLRPTFDSKGKFKDYETQVVEDNLWEDKDDEIGDTAKSDVLFPSRWAKDSAGTQQRSKKCCDKKQVAVVMIFLLFSVGIVGIILLAGDEKLEDGSASTAPEPTDQEGIEEDIFGFMYGAEKLDLSTYGYPYIKDSARGFISWPPEFDKNSFNDFESDDGITSITECAAKCQELDLATGSWSQHLQTCWCYQVAVSNICIEPCVENDYQDFSRVPIPNINFCEKSICDKDWYYSKEYCDDEIKFDEAACDAEIKALGSLSTDIEDDVASVPSKIEAIASHPAATSPTEIPSISDANDATTEIDLSEYGYSHTKSSAGGWISWPPEFDNDSFDDFEPGDGVTSLEECAAKCQELGTPTGAWSARFQTCWCNNVAVSDICLEPCIENDYIDFSRTSFSGIPACQKSICDKEWYFSEEYCNNVVKFDEEACDAKLETLASSSASNPAASPTVSSSTSDIIDLSTYGYSHTDNTAEGWITWPPEFQDNNAVDDFGPGDGINSLDECAAKCQLLKSSTGAWSTQFKTCKCYYVDVANLCKEPCIENDYQDFSTVAFSDIDYCKKSTCDQDMYYTADYCDVDVKFDKDVCDAKIEDLSKIHIVPSASTYIRKITPDISFGNQPLRIERDESISFIRFDLSAVSEGDVISKAMLNLHHRNTVKAFDGVIDVEHVFAGDWTVSSVTWNNPPKSINSYEVASFDVNSNALPADATKQLYVVDITSAINPAYSEITFKLSTQSDGIWWFAHRQDENGPELVITLGA